MRVLVVPLLVLLIAGCCCPPRPACCPEPAAAETAEAPATEVPQPAGVSEEDDGADGPSVVMHEILASKRVKGLDWEEQNLDQVLSYLRTITGLNFYLMPRARDEKLDDVLITAQLDDVSVREVLDSVVTEPFGLRWELRGGIIFVLVADDVAGPLRLRYFDVRDLIGSGKQPWSSGSVLVREIKLNVYPRYWDRDNTVVESRNGVLIARASDPVQAALESYLAYERNRLATSPVLAPAAK